ncbi:MAG: hypothetical protein ABI690_23980 [Chloroflexota bacterium]
MENKLIVPGQSRTLASVLGVMIVVFAALTLIAGLPPADQRTNFVLGIIVLIAVIAGIGLLGWHFLLRPLPANIQVVAQPLLTARTRQIIALILTLGVLSIGIAGVWDEIWHVKYGIPFGQDFFWRPHLMLYFGLSTLAIVGGWSWWTLMTRGKGTLQQRFRANPLMGITFLGGLFTVYAVGADPIWHKFYGTDLAPWSLPHLLILMLVFWMSLLAIAYHKTLMPQRDWRLKFNFHWRDILIVFVMVGGLLDFMLIFTIQWYGASSGAKQMAQVMSYPVWMLAVFITFLVTLFGVTVLHATRQIGSATLVGVLTFAIRLLLDTGLSGVRSGIPPLWLILPMMVALDIWYALAIRRTQKPPVYWTTAIVLAAVFAIVCVPITSVVFPFLPLTPLNIVGMVVASLVVAAGGVWLGQFVGGMSAYGGAEAAPAAASQTTAVPRSWSSALLYVAFLAFVVIFVATATPPV